jgi:hypothetical protein
VKGARIQRPVLSGLAVSQKRGPTLAETLDSAVVGAGAARLAPAPAEGGQLG